MLEKLSESSHLNIEQLTQLGDKSYYSNEKCNGCGVCSRVCPVNNINMVDNKPSWQHHCETCFACFHWCPNGAINGGWISIDKGYHHSDVKISEMLK